MKPETLLWRQAHPNFMHDDVITSEVFTPTKKDEYQLSLYDGGGISASDSHAHYTSTLGFQSGGVWAISVSEATAEKLPPEASPYDDNPHHVHLDFAAFDKKLRRAIAKKLRDIALARGCSFKPAQ